MARTVQQINTEIVSSLVTTFAAEGITINPTLWSKANLLRLICYVCAIALSVFEQLQDLAIEKMQAIQDASATGSAKWIQDAVFKFQYNATTPQYLVTIAGIPQYAVINESWRIVTACAVSVSVSNQVAVKVAKGTTTLGALNAFELTALQDYITQKGIAGITYNVASSDADQLYIEAEIFYSGIYSAVIQNNVIAAIDSYLLNLSKTRFGGDILMSDIEVLIRSIEGVNDVKFERVSLRYDSQALFGGIDLTLAGTVINRKYEMLAGYAIQESTASNTFADKLTFTAE